MLKDITLGIEKGEYVSIIGHSGCGKSTLLNLVAGLLPVTAGCVLLENKEVNDPGPDRAVVFQNHSLLPWLTVYDNVALAVDKVFSGTKSRAERHDWVMHNLDLVQMGHAKDKRPAEISGGMKQRVGLARALAMEPKVLLLDEPFGALDALTRAHLQDSVMAIHGKLGNTVLMITHDVDEAVLLSDRIVMMTNGPAARIGEVLDVPLARPRKRLALAADPPTSSAASACSSSSTSGTASSKRRDMSSDFTPEQKRYLEGFSSGLQIARLGRGPGASRAKPSGPDAEHIAAQDRVLAAGKKLSDQEKFKREQHPFDAYRACRSRRRRTSFPSPPTISAGAITGCSMSRRRRTPTCAGCASRTASSSTGSCPASPISPSATAAAIRTSPRARISRSARSSRRTRCSCSKRSSISACARSGTGADNIRNVTGTPTAGIDPQELLDTRPYARAWHYPHPQRARALRPAAQVQRGVRRRRPHRGAGGHQRHRLPGGRGEGRLRRRARRLVPPRARRHHRPPGFRARHRRGGEAGRCDQGGGRHRAGVHRPRRPHRPQQGAAEIRARRHGLREVPGAGRGEARCKTHSRAA